MSNLFSHYWQHFQIILFVFRFRVLYNRSIKSWQARELYERYHFLHNSVFFKHLPAKQKHQVSHSLKKQTLKFGNLIMKQSEPNTDIHFIIRYEYTYSLWHKITLDPLLSPIQHKNSKCHPWIGLLMYWECLLMLEVNLSGFEIAIPSNYNDNLTPALQITCWKGPKKLTKYLH